MPYIRLRPAFGLGEDWNFFLQLWKLAPDRIAPSFRAG